MSQLSQSGSVTVQYSTEQRASLVIPVRARRRAGQPHAVESRHRHAQVIQVCVSQVGNPYLTPTFAGTLKVVSILPSLTSGVGDGERQVGGGQVGNPYLTPIFAGTLKVVSILPSLTSGVCDRESRQYGKDTETKQQVACGLN